MSRPVAPPRTAVVLGDQGPVSSSQRSARPSSPRAMLRRRPRLSRRLTPVAAAGEEGESQEESVAPEPSHYGSRLHRLPCRPTNLILLHPSGLSSRPAPHRPFADSLPDEVRSSPSTRSALNSCAGLGIDPCGAARDPRDKGRDPCNGGQDPRDKGRDPRDRGRGPRGRGRDPRDRGRDPRDKGRDPHGAGRDPRGAGRQPHHADCDPRGVATHQMAMYVCSAMD